jgi:opacity protein-like surface antigen
VGGETGFLYNSVDSIGGSSVSGYDLEYYQIPFLGVVNYEFHNSTPFTPVINGGLGFVVGVLEASDHGNYDSASSAAFAYQVGAGVDYAINDKMALGLTYKFLGTTDQDFDNDYYYYDSNNGYYYSYGGSMKMDGAMNHMVAVVFKVRF